ncbi:PIN domain-containing protein [Candidatus Sumerlaeota bacterium]|nr:PIN domain-containing protein [Candidatus Sumerlaeota bacterium]
MAIVESLAGKVIYLDANIFIYSIEGLRPFADAARRIFEGMERGEFRCRTSELSLAECMVMPLRMGQEKIADIYDKTIRIRPHFLPVPIDRSVLKEAARIRFASSAIRLPDAIHAAIARLTGCEFFLTNDARLQGISEIKVLAMSDFRTGQ